MKARQKGYTIIEVMIFLAISGALFTMSVIGMNGQLNRSRFKQGMETIQANIVDVMDSVDKGYTLSDGTKTCIANGNTLTIQNGATQTGSNSSNCLFYGRDIDICASNSQFAVSTYLANNRAITQPSAYPPVNMPALASTIGLPAGIIFVPTIPSAPNATTSTTGCHLASLHQNSNENYQKVPRFQGDKQASAVTNPNWTGLDDTKPLRWCFQNGANSTLKASIIITQVNVALNIGDSLC